MMQDPVSHLKRPPFLHGLAVLALALSAAGLPAAPAWAQATAATPPPAAGATAPPPSSAVKPKTKATRPAWKELTPQQQQALQPLAPHWEALPVERKQKWLALSKNYHALPEVEQAKLHSRMRDWVLLSQQQRTQARLNYAETQKLPQEQKSAQWQAYQQLSAEEKRRLAAKAPPKPSGAAVVRPVPSEKLPQITPTKASRQQTPATPPINRQTLLPQPPAPPVAAPAITAPAVSAEPPPPATTD